MKSNRKTQNAPGNSEFKRLRHGENTNMHSGISEKQGNQTGMVPTRSEGGLPYNTKPVLSVSARPLLAERYAFSIISIT
jgi:hypothetical protein